MSRPARSRLRVGDCPLNPEPYEPPVVIAAFEHQVGSLRSHDLGVSAVLLDDEIGRTPDVDIRGHRRNSTTMSRPP
jgi:hypothetical protein